MLKISMRTSAHYGRQMATLIQITDLHLLADRSAILKGINPWVSLERVLESIRNSQVGLDLVLITGDLTHDGKRESYQHVLTAIRDWIPKTCWIPGNHDDRQQMAELTIPTLFASSNEGVPFPRDSLVFAVEMGGWRIIGLDTLVPGELYGQIGESQLSWLADELAKHAQNPTLVCMHHPPVPVGSLWLDRIGLVDREAFSRLIDSSPQVKLICCGHIHQEFESQIGSARVLAAPSTSVQFLPRTEALVVDDSPPGYRLLLLSKDAIETIVARSPR